MNGEQRGLLAAADAVFDAQRALRRAAETVDELSDVAASSLRVLDDAATDTFYAHQEDRREFYLESAGEHLGRLRNRSGVMNDLGDELTRHLSAASSAIERAGEELGRGPDVDEHDTDVRALRSQMDVLGEVVALARPVADQITRHALHAAESSTATDALMLLDSRVHDASREVNRADEGCVDDEVRHRERAVEGPHVGRAGWLPQLRGNPSSCSCRGLGHDQPDVDERTAAADTPAGPAARPGHRHLTGTPPPQHREEVYVPWATAHRSKSSSTPAHPRG